MSDENGAPRFNKLAEGYKLTLTDESMAARVPRELDEFVNRVVIYAAEDVEAALLVPACLPRESALRVRFTITRQTPGTGEYAFSCRLGAPGFQTGSGAALDISADKVKLSHGEQRSFDYLLRPEPYLWGGGAVTLAVENFAIRRGDEEFTLNRRMEAVVKPVDQTLDAFYLSACYGRPMDKQLTETFDERLWIAKLLLLRRGSSIIVDRVLPPPFGQYSYNAQQLQLRRELEEYYPAPRGEAEAPPAGRTAEAPAVSAPEPGGLRSTALRRLQPLAGAGRGPEGSRLFGGDHARARQGPGLRGRRGRVHRRGLRAGRQRRDPAGERLPLQIGRARGRRGADLQPLHRRQGSSGARHLRRGGQPREARPGSSACGSAGSPSGSGSSPSSSSRRTGANGC